MANWYYSRGGQQSGPMSEDDLRRLVAKGEVGAEDLIWRDGMGNWLPVRNVPEFGGSPPPVYLDPAPNFQPAQAAPVDRGPSGRPGKAARGRQKQQQLSYQTPAPAYGGGGGGDEGLSGLDWALILLCPGIAFIIGIIRLCTGKVQSGLTMIIASFIVSAIGTGIRFALYSAHG